jgi:hypothetical protein
VNFIVEWQRLDQTGCGVLSTAENDNGLFSHGSFFLGIPAMCHGGIDPSAKLKFWLWDVSEMRRRSFVSHIVAGGGAELCWGTRRVPGCIPTRACERSKCGNKKRAPCKAPFVDSGVTEPSLNPLSARHPP